MIRTIAVLGTLAIAGCDTEVGTGGGPTAPPTSGKDSCNAAAYAGLIGQDAVVTLAIPDPKRSYRRDEAVPTTFDASRVNVLLDETDRIIAIHCG